MMVLMEFARARIRKWRRKISSWMWEPMGSSWGLYTAPTDIHTAPKEEYPKGRVCDGGGWGVYEGGMLLGIYKKRRYL